DDLLGLARADRQCEVAGAGLVGGAHVRGLAAGRGQHLEHAGEMGIERHGAKSPGGPRDRPERYTTSTRPARPPPRALHRHPDWAIPEPSEPDFACRAAAAACGPPSGDTP